MKKTTFYIVGKHAVTEALKNPNRNVLRIFLTELISISIMFLLFSLENIFKLFGEACKNHADTKLK